jgi:hypothetical protein
VTDSEAPTRQRTRNEIDPLASGIWRRIEPGSRRLTLLKRPRAGNRPTPEAEADGQRDEDAGVPPSGRDVRLPGLEDIRESVRRDRPFGSSGWTLETAKALGLEYSLRLRGRPSREREGRGETVRVSRRTEI